MTGSAEAPDEELLPALRACMAEAFASLRRTVRTNLAVLTLSFVRVVGAARSGQGHLSLAALSRVLPTRGTPHARAKRLHRFLDNAHLDPRGVTDGLARLIFGRRGAGFWPILFDQTQCDSTPSGSTQALFAGVPYEGRTLPLAVYTFRYPWRERAADSQNQLERVFLLDLAAALPEGTRAVFIGDRGYARASLLRQSAYDERLFVIRGRGGTGVEHQGQSLKLAELPGEDGKAVRYTAVHYHAEQRVPVDVIVYRDPTFQEPWWLLVPPRSAAVLPTAVVVALYRERMQVEHSFRDFKTHLGLRGLKLEVRIAERTGRLLLAFCIAYCLALVLGASREGQAARADLEVLRRRPRHGTRRTLSVLSVAMQMMSHPRWRRRAWNALLDLARRLASGHRLLERGPPQVPNLVFDAA